ncbi:MAG: hydroxypyruvate isomerase family protein [Halanaerobiaceae bacterium]
MSNKLSVCIEMIYSNLPLEERIEKVAELGIKGVEFWGWQNKNLEKIEAKIKKSGLKLTAFTGSDHPLTDPEQSEAAVKDLEKAVEIAADIDSSNIIVTAGQEQEDISREIQHNNIIEVLQEVAPAAEKEGVTLVLEPLNTAVDHQGYYLSSSHEGYEILNSVDSPRVKLLFDIYHQQITEGNIIENITGNIDLIGHFHLADVPGRFEPGTGELNYPNIFSAIDKTDYTGYIGCEFRPSGSATTALEKLLEMGEFE